MYDFFFLIEKNSILLVERNKLIIKILVKNISKPKIVNCQSK